MKSCRSWFAPICLIACLAVPVSVAIAQEEQPGMPMSAAPSVEGQFWFWNGHHMAMMDLRARLGRYGRQPMGNLVYSDEGPDGELRTYTAGVDQVVIEGRKAVLSARITDTNVPEWEGLGVQIWLEDSGRPGGREDEVSAMFFRWPAAMPYEFCPMATAVVNGNVVIFP
jgi:hypothetical protein